MNLKKNYIDIGQTQDWTWSLPIWVPYFAIEAVCSVFIIIKIKQENLLNWVGYDKNYVEKEIIPYLIKQAMIL